MDSKFKYKKLSDVEWLKQHYCDEKLSCQKIANLIGCSKDGVRVAILRHGLVLRTAKDSNKGKFRNSNKYRLLNDKQWLQQKYIVEKLSTRDIAKLVKAKTPNSVRQALLRHDIKVRSVCEGLTFNREKDSFKINSDVLVGCLLGDGGLKKRKGNTFCSFYKRNKFYDHIVYVARLFYENNFLDRIKEELHECNGKNLTYFKLSTLVYKEFNEFFENWYPAFNDYKKIVPENIEINETILLHWFMDDGSTSWRKRNGKLTSQVRLVFCSESFSKEDQQMLCDKINERYDLDVRLNKTNFGTGWRIKVPQSKVDRFFKIIGDCPVPSMLYKWKIPSNEK